MKWFSFSSIATFFHALLSLSFPPHLSWATSVTFWSPCYLIVQASPVQLEVPTSDLTATSLTALASVRLQCQECGLDPSYFPLPHSHQSSGSRPYCQVQRRERWTKHVSLVLLAMVSLDHQHHLWGRHSNKALPWEPSGSVSGIQQGSPNCSFLGWEIYSSSTSSNLCVWISLWSLAVWIPSSGKHSSWIEYRHKGLWSGFLLKCAINSWDSRAFKGFVIIGGNVSCYEINLKFSVV